MVKTLKAIVATVFLLSTVGCTIRLVDFTIISTKNIDLARASSFSRGKSRVQGEHSAAIIIFIPTGVPSVKTAIDRAIESVPGAVALVDGVVTEKSWWFIFGMSGYVVEGTPLIDSSLASAEMKSNFMIAKLNRDGSVKDFRYVSEEEYTKVHNRYLGPNQKQVKL